MTRQENVLVAQRTLADNIYRSLRLDGLPVTYFQTDAILENLVTDAKPSTIQDVLSLKLGWRYVLETLDLNLDLKWIKTCCKYISSTPLHVSDSLIQTDTEMADSTLHQELESIKSIEHTADRAIALYCWIMRNQLYSDVNTRIANLVANFELIRNGAGILSVPEHHIAGFRIMLVNYYESNNLSDIAEFIHHKCLYETTTFQSKEDLEANQPR